MEVSPFQGIRYNQSKVGDLAQVICPPYDVITPEQQNSHYKESSYNAIRLEFPAEAQETTLDHYQRAATTFQQWLKQGILQLDSVDGFYLHDHRFEYSGEWRIRRGVIARVKLEPWGSGIYPHEETFPKAKGDRLQLMRACRANFSPLLALYDDSGQSTHILSELSQVKPMIETSVLSSATKGIQYNGGESHTLWAITKPEIKQELSQLLSSQPLYIADGHHRYETALTYQQERAQANYGQIPSPLMGEGQGEGEKAFNYVMLELVDFSDPGLVVLPLHRLVRGIAPSFLGGLSNHLKNFFVLQTIPLKDDNCDLPTDSCLAILGLQPGLLVVLKIRPDISLEAMMPENRCQAYREFDVSILNHIVLDKVLSRAKELDVAYTVDLEEAHRHIREGNYQLAFLLNPPQPEMVKAIADARDRMPAKSTYFYPKLPAGLVINPLN